jgi:phosphatidylserine/phosphatidylglycerophosphate/cardiolipin synthase-like enzyme
VKIKGPNINAKEVYEAAKDAAQGGSKVQLLLSRENNKYKSILSGGNNRQIVRKLNKLPPEIRKNIEIRWFATPADGVKSAEERIAKAHTKYYSVDGQWHYLGSQNPDHVSFHTSREIGIGVDDAKATAKMDRILFDNDWENAVPADPGHFWEL